MAPTFIQRWKHLPKPRIPGLANESGSPGLNPTRAILRTVQSNVTQITATRKHNQTFRTSATLSGRHVSY